MCPVDNLESGSDLIQWRVGLTLVRRKPNLPRHKGHRRLPGTPRSPAISGVAARAPAGLGQDLLRQLRHGGLAQHGALPLQERAIQSVFLGACRPELIDSGTSEETGAGDGGARQVGVRHRPGGGGGSWDFSHRRSAQPFAPDIAASTHGRIPRTGGDQAPCQPVSLAFRRTYWAAY